MSLYRTRAYDDEDDRADIDVDDVTDYLDRELRKHSIYLSSTDIKASCQDLKTAITESAYSYTDSRKERVIKVLKKRLGQDLDSNGTQGLYRSRARFLTLCYVTKRRQWNWLGRALLDFFDQKNAKIRSEEESFLLTEWCLGIMQLEGLVPEDKRKQAFREIARLGPPMFEEWRRTGPLCAWVQELVGNFREMMEFDGGRGRNQLLVSRPRLRPLRRASQPGLHDRDILLDLAPRARFGGAMVGHGVMRDVDDLQINQHLQACQLGRLRRDVDDLRFPF